MGFPGGETLPSTLTYKQRQAIAKDDVFNYNSLYNSAATNQGVFGRLYNDASVRQTRALRPTPPEPLFPQEPRSHFAARDAKSGFVSNTKIAIYNPNTTIKTGHQDAPELGRMEDTHPIPLGKFKKSNHVDYYSAIRRDAETTNQTLRMLGNYSTDFDHAKKVGAFIPHGCPGGPGLRDGNSWFHSDVRLTQSADFTSTGARTLGPFNGRTNKSMICMR